MSATAQPETDKSEILIYFLASPKDEAVCDTIHRHLTPIVRNSPVPITVLDDFDVPAGADRDAHHARLLDADIVLSLISADFIDDDDIYLRNQKVIDRYNRGETLMISVLVRNCLWKALPLARLPLLPKNHQPLNNRQFWNSEDDAVMAVVGDLYDDINGMLAHVPMLELSPAPAPDQAIDIDLTTESPGSPVPVGATTGPPTAGPSDAVEAETPAASTADVVPDTEVVVELPAAKPAPAGAAAGDAPTQAAATFTMPRPAATAPIASDWRRRYYWRVTWKRALALALDYLILTFVPFIAYFIVAEMLGTSTATDDVATWVIAIAMFYIVAPLAEASEWRATPGKRILRLEITTEEGARISYLRAFVRNVLRTLTLYSYFFVIPLVIQYFRFRKTKKLFHDELSSTVIGERVARAPARVPAAATA